MGLDPSTTPIISLQAWDDQCQADPLVNPPPKETKKQTKTIEALLIATPKNNAQLEQVEAILANANDFDAVLSGKPHSNNMNDVVEELATTEVKAGDQ